MARVLVATPEPIGRRLAGPAVRAAEIARVLGGDHDVTLVSLAGAATSPIDGRQVRGPDAITSHFDAAVVQGSVLVQHPELAESQMPLAIDWFDPFHVEALHRGGGDHVRRVDLIEGARVTLRAQAERGDFFLCSNEEQRSHWLGWLAAAGRLNHLTHDDDPLFETLISLAPFGIGDTRAGSSRSIRDAFSVVGDHDPVILWAGGLHDWLDPLSIIRAMPTVLDENPDARLVFLAGPHPNTKIEVMGVRGEAISLARELRMFAKHVLFVNQWVDFEERLGWLNDATIGVVADRAHLESAYSHRTRLLDHLAVGLPTVSTNGDPLSTKLEEAGAAITTARSDHAIGHALADLVNDDERLGEMSRAAKTLSASLTWDQTLAPLVEWMRNPRPAIDRRAGATTGNSDASTRDRAVGRVRLHLEDGGVKQVLQRGVDAGRRRLGR